MLLRCVRVEYGNKILAQHVQGLTEMKKRREAKRRKKGRGRQRKRRKEGERKNTHDTGVFSPHSRG